MCCKVTRQKLDLRKSTILASEIYNFLNLSYLNSKPHELRNDFHTIVLLAVLVVFYIQRRKKRLEEKEEELDTLKQLWVDAQKENTANDQFFKKILLQQMGIIRMIATNPTPHNQEFLTQMKRIAQEDIDTDDLLVWEDLYKVIDSIYDNFYSNTRLRFGNVLIDRELQLCCLLKANFSTKEISVVTRQSVRTVYQRKTTIRQKLNMDEKEDIAEFLCK